MTQQVDLIVQKSDGSLAPRGTDFIALGYVFVAAANAPLLDTAAGTLTNIRKPITVADDVVESVDTTDDNVTLTAHGRETGDGPFVSNETMGALAIGAQFWVIVDNANEYGIASSLANAYAGTRVALTGTEAGATISDIPGTTRRGIDGHFTYEPTADEGQYLSAVIVSGTDYERELGFGGMSTVESNSPWDSDDGSGTGRTMGDLQRGIARTAMARIIIDPVTGEYVVRKLDDDGDSHGGTISATGRDDVDLSGLA